MFNEKSSGTETILRVIVVLVMITVAAVLRIAPHPWNLTPVGAMALFSGAMVKDKKWALLFPLLAMFAGDVFVGFHKLMPVVYASFLVSVAIGMFLREKRSVGRIAGATLLGAIQFFLVTNFAVWLGFTTYPKSIAGLLTCYAAGVPYFWNTLAGDAIYATVLFGGFAMAERMFPALRAQEVGEAR